MKQVTCRKCGKTFEAQRSTAKFCSDSCRSGYHQRGNQLDEDLRTIRMALGRISTTARQQPELVTKSHADQLNRLAAWMAKEESNLFEAYMNARKAAEEDSQEADTGTR